LHFHLMKIAVKEVEFMRPMGSGLTPS
jgi:hypothetical protein